MRKMHHGYQCHNLGIGTRRDHYQTILWISQRSVSQGNRTRGNYQELALVMKKSSFLPIKLSLLQHNQVLPLTITTRTTSPQITKEAY